MQTYFSPTLQRPHFPIPHFIRISREVMMFSEFAGMNDIGVVIVAYFVVIPEAGQDERKD